MTGCHMTINAAAKAMNGEVRGEDCEFDGVVTDSRKLEKGQLFFALSGPNYDGHDFVEQAKQIGAVAVVVDRDVSTHIPQIIVKDVLLALGKLAAAWRGILNVPIVAITGSNGKTTVKEMVASIMSGQGNAFATQGNLNNDIGVPVSLLSIDVHHSVAVIEMGANHPKEIEYLTNLVHPNIALVNNAAAAHLEGFGNLEGVAKAKGEIYGGLCLDGYAIINADDNFSEYWLSLVSKYSVLTFGVKNKADVTCVYHSDEAGSHLKIASPSGSFDCLLQLHGLHNVMNALAATTVAIAADVPVDVIRAGLERMQPVAGRLQQKKGRNGALIIDDTYNANPSSTYAALDVLQRFSGRKIFALGDMGELGNNKLELHKNVGEYAKSHDVDILLGVGDLSKAAVAAFGDNAWHFSNKEEMIDALREKLGMQVVLLVKGSRSMEMNEVVSACLIEKSPEEDS